MSLISAINDVSSTGYPPQWLEAWNVFLRSVLSLCPHPALDPLAFQPQICKFSRKLKESSWLMSDTAFRYIAASNVSMAWGKVNEQLYNDILRPFPTAAASIATPMAIVLWPPQPFGPSTASSATTFSNTYDSPSTAPNLPSRPGHSQQAAICRDFNRRTCCCSNCQFKHICSKPDCGSRKLPRLPVPESTSAVIVHGKCLKVSWIGAVSSWG